MNGSLFMLALRQAASPRCLFVIVLFAALLVGIGIFRRVAAPDDDLIFHVLDPLVIATFLPISVMTIATTAFGNEVEDRTLGLLATKPVSRLAIVLAKLGATLAVTAPLVIAVSITIAVMGSGGSPGSAALSAGVGSALGAVAYAAVFMWAGLVNSRALGFALVYVLLWEALMASIIGGIRYLSVRSYTIGVMHGLDDNVFETFSSRAIELPAALAGIIIATVCFTYLTVRRLNRMDIP